jgi:hypothetical protein
LDLPLNISANVSYPLLASVFRYISSTNSKIKGDGKKILFFYTGECKPQPPALGQSLKWPPTGGKNYLLSIANARIYTQQSFNLSKFATAEMEETHYHSLPREDGRRHVLYNAFANITYFHYIQAFQHKFIAAPVILR